MQSPQIELELNIALIPEAGLGQRLAAASQVAAEHYPAVVQLSEAAGRRLAIAPHLTLLQVRLPLAAIATVHDRLAGLCKHYTQFITQATTYAYDVGECSLEVRYVVTQSLLSLQTEVIDQLNPLRGQLLLEYDPAGHDMRELLQLPGPQGDDVRRTGYWEVGDPGKNGFFRPHTTLNWFRPNTVVDLSAAWLPPVNEMNGTYDALGMYILGPYGTCPQLLAAYELRTEKQKATSEA